VSALPERLAGIATQCLDAMSNRPADALAIIYEAVLDPRGVLIRGTTRIGEQRASTGFLISYRDIDVIDPEALDVGASGIEHVRSSLEALAGQAST